MLLLKQQQQGRHQSWSVPSADKDEWLFLAAVSSFASSTQGIVSPSAEELCGTLGTENRKIATRKRVTVRECERDSEKRSKTVREGAARMVSASTKRKKKKGALYPIIISAGILCTYILGCLWTRQQGLDVTSRRNNTKRRRRRRVGCSGMWGSKHNKPKWNIRALTLNFFICSQVFGSSFRSPLRLCDTRIEGVISCRLDGAAQESCCRKPLRCFVEIFLFEAATINTINIKRAYESSRTTETSRHTVNLQQMNHLSLQLLSA